MTRPEVNVSEHLPLEPSKLLTLHFAIEGANGYQIMRACNEESLAMGGRRLSIGNFSPMVKRCIEAGLLESTDNDDDPRKSKTLKTTDLGKSVIAAQVERNAILIRLLEEGFKKAALKEN